MHVHGRRARVGSAIAIVVATLAFGPSANAAVGDMDDLTLSVQHTDTATIAGQVVTMTLNVTAKGPADATNVVLAGPLSNGFSLISIAAPGVSCTSLPCVLGDIPVNTSVPVTVQSQVPATIGKGSGIGTYFSVTGDESDPTPGNNYGLFSTVVTQSATVSPYAWLPSQAQLPPLSEGTGVVLTDGRVLIAGGTVHTSSSASAWLYDPATDQAVAVAPMPEPENEGTGILLADGRVMIAGGFGPTADGTQAQIYDPGTNSWSLTPAMSHVRETPILTQLPDGSVIAAGNGSGIDIWSPTAPYWSSQSTPYGFVPQALAPLPNGELLAASAMGDTQARMWIYNPTTYSWRETTPMPENRVYETATALPGGDILVAGGYGYAGSDIQSLATWVYHPASATWAAAGVAGAHNTNERAVTLTDGRVLLAGGSWSNTDIFDPRSRTWTPGPQVSGAYASIPYWPVIVPLPSGSALFSGAGFGTVLLGPNSAYTPADSTAPTVTGSPDRQPNANGWYNSSVTVSWHAVDSDSPVTDPPPTTLAGDGANQTASAAQVCDPSQNCTTGNYSPISIDQTPPTIGATVSGTPNDAGWRNSQPTASFTCSDSLSGVATCPAPIVVGDGAGQTVNGTTTDRAGNTTAIAVNGLNVDTVAPSVAINGVAPGSKYVVGTSLTPTCSANDSLSGLAAPCTLTITGGNSNGVGPFTATATATDIAGNTATTTVHYDVVYGWQGFDQPINDTAHQSGQSTSAFKAGSTVPAQFTLVNANGQVITPASAPEWLTPVEGVAATQPVDETVYGDPGDSGNAYRQAGTQWKYNWKTPAGGAGYYWRLGVRLDDGQTYFVNIALR